MDRVHKGVHRLGPQGWSMDWIYRGGPWTGCPCFVYVHVQCAKKVMSDSLGLVDFDIRLVIFVPNFPNGQVLFFWEIQITGL